MIAGGPGSIRPRTFGSLRHSFDQIPPVAPPSRLESGAVLAEGELSSGMSTSHALNALQVLLRPPTWDDVPLLFEIVSDPVGCEMAGVKPHTRDAHFAKWKEIFANPAINTRVIQVATPQGAACSPEVVGSISVFQAPEEARDSVGYWIARPYWGKGVASRALMMFLQEEARRPLHATAAASNLASHRVLERNGFRRVRTYACEETERYMACDVAEFVLEA